MLLFRFLLFHAPLLKAANGFHLFSETIKPISNQSAQQFSSLQKGKILDVQLVIGATESERILIKDLSLAFSLEIPEMIALYTYAKSGDHSEYKVNHHQLKIIKQGHFIGMNGAETFPLDQGVWEMIWEEQVGHWSLLCSLRVPAEVHKSAAVLKPCRIFLEIPLWTKEGLSKGRSRKNAMAEQKEVYHKLQEKELDEMKKTNNPLLKVIHFRGACAANEHDSFLDMNYFTSIPDDKDLVSFSNGLLLCTKGTVYTMDKNPFGIEKKIELGYTKVNPKQDLGLENMAP